MLKILTRKLRNRFEVREKVFSEISILSGEDPADMKKPKGGLRVSGLVDEGFIKRYSDLHDKSKEVYRTLFGEVELRRNQNPRESLRGFLNVSCIWISARKSALE